MSEFQYTLGVEEASLVRRALEAYHAHLMALKTNKSASNELERIEKLFAKIGEAEIP